MQLSIWDFVFCTKVNWLSFFERKENIILPCLRCDISVWFEICYEIWHLYSIRKFDSCMLEERGTGAHVCRTFDYLPYRWRSESAKLESFAYLMKCVFKLLEFIWICSVEKPRGFVSNVLQGSLLKDFARKKNLRMKHYLMFSILLYYNMH